MTALDPCNCGHLRAHHHHAGTGRCAHPRCTCEAYTTNPTPDTPTQDTLL